MKCAVRFALRVIRSTRYGDVDVLTAENSKITFSLHGGAHVAPKTILCVITDRNTDLKLLGFGLGFFFKMSGNRGQSLGGYEVTDRI